MKRVAIAVILNFYGFGCGAEKTDSATATSAPETGDTKTDTGTTTETDETTEKETETEPDMNPDAYPVAEGFTKIAVSSYQAENISWRMKFDVDFQCTGAIEIRGEFINAGFIWWVSYTVASQPANWVNGYKVSELKPAEHEESAKGYNLQSRVLYKCL